jgi:CMP-N-acetylneuraminic acid synthetase
MIDGRQVLAVVPARGGSRGIKLKNLREVGGRSLVSRAGDVVSQIAEIDRAIVSTDHADIARVAREAGLDAPFIRPAEISGDFASALDVLLHALQATEAIDGCQYQVIVLLEPTSPLRTPQQVSQTIRTLIEGNWDSVWTLSPTDSKMHPLKQLAVGADGGMSFFDPRGEQIVARQQLEPVFHRNGVAYAFTRDCLLTQRTIRGVKAGALILHDEDISIDTEHDIALVEAVLAKRSISTGSGARLHSTTDQAISIQEDQS